MKLQHEEGKTPSSRRTEESRHPKPHRDSITGTGCPSEFYWSEPLRVRGTSGEGADTFIQRGRTVTGEAIDELIEDISEQLVDSENRTEKLKKQLDNIKSIRRRIDLSDSTK
jgi:hypothetical protein